MKIVSVLASLLLLIQSFNLCIDDLINFQALIEHANFHSQKYGDNIVVFFSKHYGELEADHNENHAEEKSEHEKLPLQHQVHFNSLSLFVVKDFLYVPMGENVISLHSQDSFYYCPMYSNFEKEGPFQPPRLT